MGKTVGGGGGGGRQFIGMPAKCQYKLQAVQFEVASVTHLRSDSRILESWSLIHELDQGYIYEKSMG